MPSEIHNHSIRTIVVQLAFLLIVLAEIVSAVLGYRTFVTLAGTVVGVAIIAGVVFITVIDRSASDLSRAIRTRVSRWPVVLRHTVNTEPSSHLLGRDKRAVRRWAFVAGALLVGSLVFFSAIKEFDYPTVHLLLWWEGYAILLITLIAVQSYSNGGIVMSWLLAFGAVVGVILNYGGIGLARGGPSVLELVGVALIGGLFGAAVFGTVGFGLGVTIRQIVV